uniref:Uncharacterized protein n=1 Tax=Cacopsylla melanoneura TaxID=428564 RepID=A0A8D8THC4_9HEMI
MPYIGTPITWLLTLFTNSTFDLFSESFNTLNKHSNSQNLYTSIDNKILNLSEYMAINNLNYNGLVNRLKSKKMSNGGLFMDKSGKCWVSSEDLASQNSDMGPLVKTEIVAECKYSPGLLRPTLPLRWM